MARQTFLGVSPALEGKEDCRCLQCADKGRKATRLAFRDQEARRGMTQADMAFVANQTNLKKVASLSSLSATGRSYASYVTGV
jgi:hypothetical protein